MKIKNFTCIAEDAIMEYEFNQPICFLCGRGADALMDLIRQTIGDCMPHTDLSCYNGEHFVVHTDVDIDSKEYRVCYIHNAECGENCIAVNFRENSLVYSREDTTEYMQMCKEMNETSTNVLIGTAAVKDTEDRRPIFIYDYFDRLDEAVDVTPVLNGLAGLGRQVFVAVCSSYNPIDHQNVQICAVDLV